MRRGMGIMARRADTIFEYGMDIRLIHAIIEIVMTVKTDFRFIYINIGCCGIIHPG